ncbi:MAG: hypothetical protein HY895_22120 [Deltaproteobacteria bacterium]|nr:hypothetical protein [Deltaproteobacteria bacterium]
MIIHLNKPHRVPALHYRVKPVASPVSLQQDRTICCLKLHAFLIEAISKKADHSRGQAHADKKSATTASGREHFSEVGHAASDCQMHF